MTEPENAAWVAAHRPKYPDNDFGLVSDIAWLDGFLVALYAGGQLPPEPEPADLRHAARERAENLAQLFLDHYDLSANTREFLHGDRGARTLSGIWLDGFRAGLNRRRHLTTHRWTGRN